MSNLHRSRVFHWRCLFISYYIWLRSCTVKDQTHRRVETLPMKTSTKSAFRSGVTLSSVLQWNNAKLQNYSVPWYVKVHIKMPQMKNKIQTKYANWNEEYDIFGHCTLHWIAFVSGHISRPSQAGFSYRCLCSTSEFLESGVRQEDFWQYADPT